MGSTSGKVLDYRTRTKSCRFVIVPKPWENNPKRMTADKIMRPRQKQWSLLPQLNCLTELKTNVLSFRFTQVITVLQNKVTHMGERRRLKNKKRHYTYEKLSQHIYTA